MFTPPSRLFVAPRPVAQAASSCLSDNLNSVAQAATSCLGDTIVAQAATLRGSCLSDVANSFYREEPVDKNETLLTPTFHLRVGES